jgi:methionine synthase II (cobalamin-independent)
VAVANPLYAPLLTVDGRAALAAGGVDVDAVLSVMIEADRAAVAGVAVPADFRVGLDVTDAGPLPTTAAGYDAVAVETLLDETPFQRLCVDFPADPAARLPMELVKPGLVVSLGVIDAASSSLESVEELLERLDPVVEQRGESNVAVSTNSGFAQSADSPLVTEEVQHAKLRLVETVARYYWGNEI